MKNDIVTQEELNEILAKRHSFSDLTARLNVLNFARKKKIKETDDYIIWDKKTDLSQLPPQELVKIKILRDHSILESKRSVLKWLFNRKAIGTTLHNYLYPFVKRRDPNKPDNKLSWNSWIKQAYDGYKEIGKEDIAVEFYMTNSGDTIPVLYPVDVYSPDELYKNGYYTPLYSGQFKEYLSRFKHFYDQDQFSVFIKYWINLDTAEAKFNNDRLPCTTDLPKEFLDLTCLDKWILYKGYIIIGPGTSEQELQATIDHELGHEDWQYGKDRLKLRPNQANKKLLKVNEKLLTIFEDACNELYADLNAIRKNGNIKTADDYIKIMQSCFTYRDGSSMLEETNGHKRININELNYPSECHILARNYILIHFDELKKNKFKFPYKDLVPVYTETKLYETDLPE